MGKTLKRVLALFIFTLIFTVGVKASNIDKINVGVRIDKNGDAHVKQVWHVYNTDGTEWYIPIQNLNHMELEDFKVYGKDNTKWNERKWDVDANFDEKAYSYGINKVSGGIELCWGKSNMGEQEYVIEFTYKNAVQSFPDCDGMLVRFINDQMVPYPDKASVFISIDDVNLSENNASIWGFGYNGDINFVDGKVLAKSSEFTQQSHMTVLLRLDKGVINPKYIGKGTFKKLEDRAMKGSDYKPWYIMVWLFIKNLWILIVTLIVFFATKNVNTLILKAKNRKEVDYKNPPYYRDELLDNNLSAIMIMRAQKDAPKRLSNNLIAATMLKWIKEGALEINKHKRLTSEENDLIMKKEPAEMTLAESKLWYTLKDASTFDKITTDGLEEYFEDNPEDYTGIRDEFIEDGMNYLEMNSHIKTERLTFLGLPAVVNGNTKKYYLTETGLTECSNAFAMERFLKDFTLINEKDMIDVHLWDYYLIVATLFGMSKEILKQFKDINPEYNFASDRYSNINTYNLIRTVNATSYSAQSGYNSGRSSGSGGSSSFGGGGGFSGGGSGGGSR